MPRLSWGTAGAVAGLVGLAASHAATMALTVRSSPVVAVAEVIVEWTPAVVADRAIRLLGSLGKPVLVAVVVLVLLGIMAAVGRVAARSTWLPLVAYLLLGTVAAAAIFRRDDATVVQLFPVAAGVIAWIVALAFLTEPLRREQYSEHTPPTEVPATTHTRRAFLVRAGVVAAVAAGVGVVGELWGRGRRHVEQTRRLLRLAVTNPGPPTDTGVDVVDIEPWQTPNPDFYKVHTAIIPPAIEPVAWAVRIHGMVREELVLTYQDLLDRKLTEAWITLNCVSNEVGGPLIGNAWWSGVLLEPLLEEAGVTGDADAVLQTSEDGWTCGTPLAALTDGRNAMLAIAMNGEPLPIDHGFPVRTIVPGLYGYVSACKWVVDLEVTRFDAIEPYWVERDWAEHAPVKLASRIDVPDDGADVPVGQLRVGGTAWLQNTGIEAVEYRLDGGPWEPAELAATLQDDTWVQWAATIDVDKGDHELLVRATSKAGEVQTGVERDLRPDGATGWHGVEFSAS